MKELKLQPLTREAFAPFGEVIEIDSVEPIMINNGTTERFHELAHVDVDTQKGEPIISIFRGQPFSLPIEIKMMERHPLGSQSFTPLYERPLIVVVAENSDDNEPINLQAFYVKGTQGVNYFKNTWHHPLISLEIVSRFLVVDWSGTENNLEEYFFDEGYVIKSLSA